MSTRNKVLLQIKFILSCYWRFLSIYIHFAYQAYYNDITKWPANIRENAPILNADEIKLCSLLLNVIHDRTISLYLFFLLVLEYVSLLYFHGHLVSTVYMHVHLIPPFTPSLKHTNNLNIPSAHS